MSWVPNTLLDPVTFTVLMRVANIRPNASMTSIVIKRPILLRLNSTVHAEDVTVEGNAGFIVRINLVNI